MKLYCVINLEKNEPFIVTICNNREKADELVERYKSNYKESGNYVPEFAVHEFDTDSEYHGGIVFDIYDDFLDDYEGC